MFLKIYIRAFQQASDLDDSVEEKLLVGDRPKQTNDPGKPLKDRLVYRSEEEDANVSLLYSMLIINWLTQISANLSWTAILQLHDRVGEVVRAIP